ncbi:MAG: discoidin domain-containing protein [Muribaculaceae bacterium]|nr:discoidin domain-containing protein [Muribaculaceae bacterium]
MKKLLTLGLLAALSVPAWAIDWTSVDNLAKGAAVIVSSKDNEASSITDGNDGSRWQAVKNTHDYTQDWVMLDLGENKKFTDIEILWEASNATAFSIYTSETPFDYTSHDDVDPAYKSLNTIPSNPVLQGTGENNETNTASLTFPSQQNARYVLVYCDEYSTNASNYGTSIFEIKLANIEGRNEVAGLSVVAATVLAGESTIVTIVPLNAADEELDLSLVSNITLSCSNPDAVTITPKSNGEFTVTGVKAGLYTLNAQADYNGATVTGSASLTVEYNWNTTTTSVNLKGKNVSARWLESGTENDNPAVNAIDGDKGTYYQYNGGWNGGDAWVVVDLGVDYVADAIAVYYPEGSQGKFKFSYGVADAALPATQGADYKWTDDNALEGWTSSSTLDRVSDGIATWVLDQPVTIRYIAVRDSDNPGGKPKVGEIYLSGVEYKNPKATSITLSTTPQGLFPDETAEVEYTVYDQYGTVFNPSTTPTISTTGNVTYAEGVITAGNPGAYTVTVTSGDLSATVKGMVADVEKYCMEGATITSDTNADHPEYLIDGGAEPDKNEKLFVLIENEAKGPANHWILAKLARPYNLDLIALNWEGACPEDYDVYVGDTEENLTKLYSVTGHTQFSWKDRFSGEEMNNVQYIKVNTTKNATGYGIKLHELKAYGTQAAASVPTSVAVEVYKDYVATDEEIELGGSVLDQWGGPIEGELTFYVNDQAIEGNTFTPETPGTCKVAAKYGDITSEPVSFIVAADKAIKLSTDDIVSMTLGDEEVNPLEKELQGWEINEETEDAEEGIDLQATVLTGYNPLIINFDAPMYFDLIRLDWEAACPSALEVKAVYEFDGEPQTIAKYDNRTLTMGINPDDRLVNGSYTSTTPVGYDNILRGNLEKITTLIIQPLDKDHNYPLRLIKLHMYGSADKEATDIEGLGNSLNSGLVDVISLQGVVVKRNVKAADAASNLPKGLYIIGGKKVMVK